MNTRKGIGSYLLTVLVVALAIPAAAATKVVAMTAEAQLERAALAVASAESAGAATWARELYDEAQAHLVSARGLMNDKKSSRREDSRVAADDAYYAARAAEAKARWGADVSEINALRTDIVRFGGRVDPLTLEVEPSGLIDRGKTSKDKIAFAQAIVDRAKAMGAQTVDPSEILQAEQYLASAKKIVTSDRYSSNADHLSYVAEMLARRAMYASSRGEVTRYLSPLRLERTRQAQQATEARLVQERQQREAAERQRAELQAQLDAQAANRKAQQAEIASLRAQVAANQQQMQSRLEEDRAARVEAERRLDTLMSQYETSVSNARDAAQTEALRRQVEDQRLALQSMQEHERLSEQSSMTEIDRLKTELEKERTSGKTNAQTLSTREDELTRRQNELAAMRRAREEDERARTEMQRKHEAALREAQEKAEAAQQRAAAAEAESARLRQQVAGTQAELTQAKQQIAQRDATEQERVDRMQKAIAAVAQTRSDNRGFIVTLPGVFFDTGKTSLKPGARNVLSRIVTQLRTNDKVRVTIEGHTDSVGSEETNQQLSEKRAQAVRDYLVSRGLSAGVITTVGRGESQPIATNDTPAGRQQNRRVEMIITQ
ncbi:MAG TPA: OmpA family protein [Thermoanaerobaculia bacterium]|nr:OmpA family protein [Thermoanaerobaculia bacterium]